MTRPGDELPDQTRDDTDIGWGDDPGRAENDDELRRLLDERPPHHEDHD